MSTRTPIPGYEMPLLQIVKGNKNSDRYHIAEQDLVLIGRADICDICLRDPKVSRYHAVLLRMEGAGDSFLLRDLSSRQGTKVNGDYIYQRVLRDGDELAIADYGLRYFSEDSVKPIPALFRVVPSRLRGLGMDQTAFLGGGDGNSADLGEWLSLVSSSAAGREVLEELLKVSARTCSLAGILHEIVPAMVQAIGGQRGFAALFGDNFQIEEFIGATGIDDSAPIEVSEERFLDRLLERQIVFDDRTILAPIVSGEDIKGFFCMDRAAVKGRFSEEDGKLLLAMGQIATAYARIAKGARSAIASEGAIVEWPVELVGKSAAMRQLCMDIRKAAASDANILILGQSGTGKELVARAIHKISHPGKPAPFQARNCAAIPHALAETEIFGYAPKSGIAESDPKGAPGWFELADGGTLFLDEVQALPVSLQDKFLRVLQEKEVWRVGARQPVHVQVKVLGATDADLEAALDHGEFRRQFYHRFARQIQLVPLAYRKEDITLLAHFFLDRLGSRVRSRARTLSRSALEKLVAYHWPGNVRELEHCIERLSNGQNEVIFSWDILGLLKPSEESVSCNSTEVGGDIRLKAIKSISELERDAILEALEVMRGNISKAAEALQMSRQTLLNKMDKYSIPRNYGDN